MYSSPNTSTDFRETETWYPVEDYKESGHSIGDEQKRTHQPSDTSEDEKDTRSRLGKCTRIKCNFSEKAEVLHHAPGNPTRSRIQQRIPARFKDSSLCNDKAGENVVWSIYSVNGSV